jgi:hypothetical protein
MAFHSRVLANLRGEDRFNKILEEVKIKWEEFEVYTPDETRLRIAE